MVMIEVFQNEAVPVAVLSSSTSSSWSSWSSSSPSSSSSSSSWSPWSSSRWSSSGCGAIWPPCRAGSCLIQRWTLFHNDCRIILVMIYVYIMMKCMSVAFLFILSWASFGLVITMMTVLRMIIIKMMMIDEDEHQDVILIITPNTTRGYWPRSPVRQNPLWTDSEFSRSPRFTPTSVLAVLGYYNSIIVITW